MTIPLPPSGGDWDWLPHEVEQMRAAQRLALEAALRLVISYIGTKHIQEDILELIKEIES